MKKFVTVILLIFILITNINSVYAENYATKDEPFFVVNEYFEKYCLIEGSVYMGSTDTIVTLWIGEDNHPIYIKDTRCGKDGWFLFQYNYPETMQPGKYKYRLGSNAGTGVYEGYITYNGKTKEEIEYFTYTTADLEFIDYKPLVKIYIDCLIDVNTRLSVVDTENNIVYADETIAGGTGIKEITFTLPSTLRYNKYNIFIAYYTCKETLLKVSGTLDTGAYIKINGTIEAGNNVIDMYTNVTYSDGEYIDSFDNYTGTKTVSKSMPNVGMNGRLSFYIHGKKYHTYTSGNNVNMFDNPILYEKLRKIRTDFDSDLDRVIEAYELQSLSGKLDISGIGISDITGLEKCYNLTELDISSNTITDISQLFVLDNLKILDASNNKIDSIKRLPKNLEYADVSNNNITSIYNYNGYDKLKFLFANDNQISTIDEISQNTDLRYVNLSNNKITDISPVADWKKLMHLDVSENNIGDISPLTWNKNLTYLDLSDNNISDISNLPDNIYNTLDVSNNYITAEQTDEFFAIHKKYLPVKEN